MKTHKATAKRFKKKKKKKLVMRTCGQGHFNARQSGKKRRNKRSDHTIEGYKQTILRAIPHS